MKNSKSSLVLICTGLITLTSCGNDRSGVNPFPDPTKFQEQQMQPEKEVYILDELPQGDYKFFIRPINTSVYGMINSGSGTMSAKGDDFNINLVMDDAPNVKHMQAIQAGTRCPVAEDDTNSDGFIDYVEAIAATGPILIPLDKDLNKQESGKDIYPSGEDYSFQKTAKISSMISDLRSPDLNPSDAIEKLQGSEQLSFSGKVIVIYGAPNFKTLPATVQAMEGMTAQQSLPISCGVIELIKEE